MAELLSQEEKVSPEFFHYLLSNYSIRNFEFIISHLWLNLVHCAPTAKWTWVHKYLSGRFFFENVKISIILETLHFTFGISSFFALQKNTYWQTNR